MDIFTKHNIVICKLNYYLNYYHDLKVTII